MGTLVALEISAAERNFRDWLVARHALQNAVIYAAWLRASSSPGADLARVFSAKSWSCSIAASWVACGPFHRPEGLTHSRSHLA